MNTAKLFKTVWHINSILILIVGLMVFSFLGYAGYTFYKERSRRYGTNVVNVQPDAHINSEWRLGSFESIAGTDYIMAPAYSEQTYQLNYASEKETSAVRNYLFVNATDKLSRWLVPNNNYLFLNTERLLHSEDDSERNEVKWIEYEVIKSDTNGDGRMTSEDQLAIAISDPTGERYVEIVPNIDKILGSKMRDDNTLLIFYSSGGRNFVSEIKIPDRRVTITKELPKIQS